jgi:hypothetical protein
MLPSDTRAPAPPAPQAPARPILPGPQSPWIETLGASPKRGRGLPAVRVTARGSALNGCGRQTCESWNFSEPAVDVSKGSLAQVSTVTSPLRARPAAKKEGGEARGGNGKSAQAAERLEFEDRA